MNKFFQYTLIILLIIGFIMNHQQQMLAALLKTPFEVFELTKTLVLSLCLWNGLLKVIQASRMMDHFTFLLRPILKFIYGKCIEEESLYQNLSSNLLANLLGLGTLATLSGLKAIQLLKEKGYRQEFICGSDANFGGRRNYFTQHGNYDIFDYSTAIEKGYIESDYFVWWGYEDAILYEIAKDELTRLAADKQPFNLTFLTVDQHYFNGYVCEKCGNEYDVQLANVLACSDRLLIDFIEWCKQQDFYEDTVIVISGDHPRMDTVLVENIDYTERTVYNCFINTERTVALSEKNRKFTTMDMFPTVLYALGFDIEGDRLGLGTNLFSSEQTLAEKFGYAYIDEELSKSSLYYISHFS